MKFDLLDPGPIKTIFLIKYNIPRPSSRLPTNINGMGRGGIQCCKDIVHCCDLGISGIGNLESIICPKFLDLYASIFGS
jgi:hypothetical protein